LLKSIQKWLYNNFLKKYGFGWLYRDFFTCGNTFDHILYTRLDTCLMSISRYSLRDKVTLRLLKLYFYKADVVEWSRMIGAAVYQWCEFKSCRGKNKNLTVQRSNSNTVWFNFQTCIYIYCNVFSIDKTTIKERKNEEHQFFVYTKKDKGK
jgi:hypothetical protein